MLSPVTQPIMVSSCCTLLMIEVPVRNQVMIKIADNWCFVRRGERAAGD